MNLIKSIHGINLFLYRMYARLYRRGYMYFNNSIDEPKEHHNQFVLNQEPDFI